MKVNLTSTVGFTADGETKGLAGTLQLRFNGAVVPGADVTVSPGEVDAESDTSADLVVGDIFTVGVTTQMSGPSDSSLNVDGDVGLSVEIFELSPSASIDTVVAAHNSTATAKTFGPYLAGVPLPDTFTVTTEDPDDSINRVLYAVNGGDPQETSKGVNGQWTFDPGVGTLPLPAGGKPDTLTVTAQDASGNTLDTYTGTLIVQDDLHETLTINPPGGPAGGNGVCLRLRVPSRVAASRRPSRGRSRTCRATTSRFSK